jgi:hypothetical protein
MTHRHDVTLSLSCAETAWLARNRQTLRASAHAATAKVSDLLLWTLAEQVGDHDTYTTTTEHQPDGKIKQTVDFGANGPVITNDSNLGKALTDLFATVATRPKRVRWHQPSEDRWEGTVDGHEFIIEQPTLGGDYRWRHYIPGSDEAYATGRTRALETAMDQARQSHTAWHEARKLDEKLAAGDTAGWLFDDKPDGKSGVLAIRFGSDGTVDIEDATDDELARIDDELDRIDEQIARSVGLIGLQHPSVAPDDDGPDAA